MNPPAILTALKSALQDSAYLSDVADTNIHLGKVENVSNYPIIVIDPAAKRRIGDAKGSVEYWMMTVNILFAIKVFDQSKQYVGTASLKGIADMEKDVMKALSADYTLGGACVNLSIIDSVPDDGSDYPVRGAFMTIEIQYQQNSLTRE